MVSAFAYVCAGGTRFVFAVHSLVIIRRVTDVGGDVYWLLACTLFLLLVEMIYTLAKRHGQEWTWISPCFFFYLLSTLPGIWVLEMDRLDRYRSANETVQTRVGLSSIIWIKIPIVMRPDTWVMGLQQLLLLLLILGRWFLPKRGMTHEQLSQLLLFHVGIASDILEIIDLFEEEEVLRTPYLDYVILGAFSLSLFQFIFILTGAKVCIHRATFTQREPRGHAEMAQIGNNDYPASHDGGHVNMAFKDDSIQESYRHDHVDNRNINRKRNQCLYSEHWSILMTVMMQDGPFLAIRLYILIPLGVVNYTIIFFTCKNILILMIEFYRIIVVCAHQVTGIHEGA